MPAALSSATKTPPDTNATQIYTCKDGNVLKLLCVLYYLSVASTALKSFSTIAVTQTRDFEWFPHSYCSAEGRASLLSHGALIQTKVIRHAEMLGLFMFLSCL